MRFISMLCAVALATPLLSVAQTPIKSDWPLDSGARVRILTPFLGDHSQTVTVVSATRDMLVFRQGSEPATQSVGTPQITRLEVATGTHANKLKGALIGLLAGAAGGAIFGSATSQRPAPCQPQQFCLNLDFGRGAATAAGAAAGAVVGTLAGMLIGIHQTDTWTPVAVPVR